MLPLKICFLWHIHQPYYKKEDEFLLPWTRLHGVKDYYDLPEILHEFPSIRQTINIVPSLKMQIDEYISGKTIDRVQRLTLINAANLDEKQKESILELFFLCNVNNMIKPHKRYNELYEASNEKEHAIAKFTEQDWRDIQVWYNLAWVGELSRENRIIQRLLRKGRNYTEQEKQLLMRQHIEILENIKPQLKTLMGLDQIEISTSPMYHPILPLLCNSESAREAMPSVPMPDVPFSYPEDARSQVKDALKYVEKAYGFKPNGMWPSEGSISDEALEIMAEAGFKWAASDEEVLAETLKDKIKPTEKFFPRKFKTSKGDITLFFRDHFLSDRIGFVYSQWNHWDAANDFCHHLRNIRNEIIRQHGDEALKHAVVPVILDGENCWEYYPQNGFPFLRELYKQIENAKELSTVTCSEASSQEHSNYLEPLSHIRAGSWINANFSIWIGHDDDRKAWTMLSLAREAVEKNKDKISKEAYEKAMEEIYISEGSDWFWWYGPEHHAENKEDFDTLFRWHIEKIYQIIGEPLPENVQIAITEQISTKKLAEQRGKLTPVINGKITDSEEWENGGYYDAQGAMSAMHQIGEILDRVWYASDDNHIYLRFDNKTKLSNDDYIRINFINPKGFSLKINSTGIEFSSNKKMKFSKLVYAQDEIIEIGICKEIFYNTEDYEDFPVELSIETKHKNNTIIYPRQGNLIFNFL